MSPLRWLSALLLALAFVAGAVLLLQRQAAAQLREEIALLRDDHRALEGLRAENARLRAALPPAEELARLRADRAAVLQLRAEIERFKTQAEEKERGLANLTLPLVPAGEWKNAGRATPAATVETLFWAVTTRNLDAAAAMVGFDAKLRPAVDQMFGALPETTRLEFGTPERLIASYMIKEPPAVAMRVVEEKSDADDQAAVSIRVQNRKGLEEAMNMPLHRATDGWQMQVSAQWVQRIANMVGADLAAARKGG